MSDQRTIQQYGLVAGGPNTISLPRDARVVAVGDYFDQPTIWVEVDPFDAFMPRTFEVLPNHHYYQAGLKYVGTALLRTGPVWHVFEAPRL